MEPTEIWKRLEGYEGSYEVSNFGRIRRRSRKAGGYTYSNGSRNYGKNGSYFRINLCKYGEFPGRLIAIHRLVAEAFIGPIPEGMEINHIDGNKWNNHADNLEIVTHSYNQHHMAHILNRKQHFARGSRHGEAKLTESEVLEIRRLDKEGMSRKELSARFSIGPQMLSFIINRKNWTHI